MQLIELYTKLDDALGELERRRNNHELMSKVDHYFSSLPKPPELNDGPKAIVSRALFTPTHEIRHYIESIVPNLPIQSLFFEGSTDKFVGLNPEKRCLGKMVFSDSNLPHTFKVIEKRRVIDFNRYEGERIDRVRTLNGEKLTEFHHRLYQSYFNSKALPIVNYSKWFFSAEQFSREFSYLRYLGLFLTDGILFENYLESDKHQRSFTQSKAVPAFLELEKIFGIRPLIVPMTPLDLDSAAFWNYFPQEIKTFFSPMKDEPQPSPLSRVLSYLRAHS